MAEALPSAGMDDATLADLEHQNFIAANAIAARNAPDHLVRRRDGVVTLLTGVPIRLFNQIVIEAADAPDDAVAEGVDTARKRGDTFVVTLRKRTDDDRHPVLGRLGLVRHEADPWMPGMVLHPIPLVDPAAGAGFDIRTVTDVAGLDEHLQVAAEGFEMPIDWLRAVIGPSILSNPDCRTYLGYADGRPVVSGTGIRSGRTIGVYNIATVPSARRRGFGAAMTARIAADGAAQGCDVAVLQASSMGRPTYERLGYRTVVEYEAWVEPPTDD
jgi:GNAT superfamily N-acetyltransferase